MLATFIARPAAGASLLSLGPRALQALVVEQLFNRSGRWYLIDDAGVCYTYLESPRTHIQADRLIMDAHLVSRLGKNIGHSCLGADFASRVRLSAQVRGGDRKMILDDIRIDRIDDETARNAFNLARQLAPQSVPKSVAIDVSDLIRKQVSALSVPARVDQFRILSVVARGSAVVMQFDLILSTP